jgi:hypothetical protein
MTDGKSQTCYGLNDDIYKEITGFSDMKVGGCILGCSAIQGYNRNPIDLTQ